MARAKWMFLYRKEGTHTVWVYERLRPGGLRQRERDGWIQVWK